MRVHPVWRKPGFFRLWAAAAISQAGTQISFIALPLIAVTLLKATPLQVSLLNVADFLPAVLFSLPFGAWVDRRRLRPVLVAGDLGRAWVLAAVPAAIFWGKLSIGVLYGVVFAVGTLSILFDVSYPSYFAAQFDPEELVDGNAALELGQSFARVAGPGLAGFLIAFLTAPGSIVADVLSYLGSAVLIGGSIRGNRISRSSVRERNGAPTKNSPTTNNSFVSQIGEGVRYVAHHRYLRSLAVFAAVSNLGWAMVEGVLMVYAVRGLHLDPARVGIVFMAAGAGSVFAAGVSSLLHRRFRAGKVMVYAGMAQGAGVLLVAAAFFTLPAVLLAAGLWARSLGAAVYGINAVSLRQGVTPDGVMGRVNATMRLVGWSTLSPGFLLGGVIATRIGLSSAVWIGAAVYVLAVAGIYFSPVRSDLP